MKERKPRAYVEKCRTGYFGLGYTYRWVARDYWNNQVASARTRKECEEECRQKGYIPVR